MGETCISHEVGIGIMDIGTHRWLTHVPGNMDMSMAENPEINKEIII